MELRLICVRVENAQEKSEDGAFPHVVWNYRRPGCGSSFTGLVLGDKIHNLSFFIQKENWVGSPQEESQWGFLTFYDMQYPFL